MNALKSPLPCEVVAPDRAQGRTPSPHDGADHDHRHLVRSGLADPLPDRSGLVQGGRLRGGRVQLRLPRLRGGQHAPHVQSAQRALRLQGLLAQCAALPLQGIRDMVPAQWHRPRHRSAARGRWLRSPTRAPQCCSSQRRPSPRRSPRSCAQCPIAGQPLADQLSWSSRPSGRHNGKTEVQAR